MTRLSEDCVLLYSYSLYYITMEEIRCFAYSLRGGYHAFGKKDGEDIDTHGPYGDSTRVDVVCCVSFFFGEKGGYGLYRALLWGGAPAHATFADFRRVALWESFFLSMRG